MRNLFTTISPFVLLSIALTACSSFLPLSTPTIPIINTATEIPSPIPSTTPTFTPSITNIRAKISGWETYTDPIYGFSFQYPPSIQTCCGISGPMTGEVQPIITLADEATIVPNSDDFDGFAVYVVTNSDGLTLQEYVEREKTTQIQAGEIVLGNFTPSGSDSTVTIGRQSGIVIQGYCWDDIRRIYIPFPDSNQFLVIAVLEKSEGSFEKTMAQILSSFRFAE